MSDHGPGDEKTEQADQADQAEQSQTPRQDVPLEPDENAEGIELTMSEEPNSFEPEEDPDAAAPDLVSSQD